MIATQSVVEDSALCSLLINPMRLFSPSRCSSDEGRDVLRDSMPALKMPLLLLADEISRQPFSCARGGEQYLGNRWCCHPRVLWQHEGAVTLRKPSCVCDTCVYIFSEMLLWCSLVEPATVSFVVRPEGIICPTACCARCNRLSGATCGLQLVVSERTDVHVSGQRHSLL